MRALGQTQVVGPQIYRPMYKNTSLDGSFQVEFRSE